MNHAEYLSFRSFFTGFPAPLRNRPLIAPAEMAARIADVFKDEAPLAILLSSGMDSASLLPFLPRGSVAYTMFNEGQPDEEGPAAAAYCERFGIPHKRIAIRLDDYVDAIDPLILSKKMPLTPAEPLVFLGARFIARDGFGTVVTGGRGDSAMGGFPRVRRNLRTKSFFKALYRSYVDPAAVLRDPATINHVIAPYLRLGGQFIDTGGFLREVALARFAHPNAVSAAGCRIVQPFTAFDVRFNRLRNWFRPKYVIEDLFVHLFGHRPPPKIGLRKPPDWLAGYAPTAGIFRDFDIGSMKYTRKFLIYALERFHVLGPAVPLPAAPDVG